MLSTLISKTYANLDKVLMIRGDNKLNYSQVFSYIMDNMLCKDGFIFYSSGSTGEEKRIIHPHETFLSRYSTYRPGYITVITLDISRIGGFDALMHCFFYDGLAIVPEPIDPHNVLRSIEKYKAELLVTTPTMLRLILLVDTDRYDISSLKIISYGSEVMYQSTVDELKRRFPNIKLKQTYGLTELGVFRTHSDEHGLKILDREWNIIDGILYISDGEKLVSTGDRATSTDGYITILGRDSSTINVGGSKIIAEHVEEVLSSVCKDSLVYGEPDPLLGNIVVADVISDIQEADILEHCKKNLSKFAVPMKINFVDSIEYVGNGKKRRK